MADVHSREKKRTSNVHKMDEIGTFLYDQVD